MRHEEARGVLGARRVEACALVREPRDLGAERGALNLQLGGERVARAARHPRVAQPELAKRRCAAAATSAGSLSAPWAGSDGAVAKIVLARTPSP